MIEARTKEEKEFEIQVSKLFNVLVKYGYNPTTKEFRDIVLNRNKRKSSYFDDFLRDRIVKRHPEIERLPIHSFMKKTMVKLPKECEEIMREYVMLTNKQRILNHVVFFECIYPSPYLVKK